MKDCIGEIRFFLKKGIDEISQYDQRLEKLRSLLPSHGSVGYIADGEFDVKAFYLTQYALSPVFLINGSTEHRLVVADLRKSQDHFKFVKKNRLLPVEYTDNHIFLFKREDR